jgi:hypothetical protein
LLDDYDHEQLNKKGRTVREAICLDLAEYHVVVDAIKADFDSAVFGWIFLSKVRHDSSESTPLIPGQSTPLSWQQSSGFWRASV